MLNLKVEMALCTHRFGLYLNFGFIDFFRTSVRYSIGYSGFEKMSRQVSVYMTAAST